MQWQDWKKEAWAAFEIKQKVKEEALQITQNDQFATPTVIGHRVTKFLDVKKKKVSGWGKTNRKRKAGLQA